MLEGWSRRRNGGCCWGDRLVVLVLVVVVVVAAVKWFFSGTLERLTSVKDSCSASSSVKFFLLAALCL